MVISEIDSKEVIVKSKLPGADYVINPYIGCSHRCLYCYASFMQRFSKHTEPWGDFVDVKINYREIKKEKLSGKVVLLGSVTDPYQHAERKYLATRRILEKLVGCDCAIEILTKSDLVLRDIDLIKKFENITIGVSLNTVDENFRKDIEPGAVSIQRRIELLKELQRLQIRTYVFVSPIFPEITDIQKLIERTRLYTDYYCFENLNLRGKYKKSILEYIKEKYPRQLPLYEEIYVNKSMKYWEDMLGQISEIAERENINSKIYFYHEKIKKK